MCLQKTSGPTFFQPPPHTHSGTPTQYLLTAAGALLELNAHAPPHAAWLAGGWLASDGRALFATPLDPLLLALPRLAAGTAAGYVDAVTAVGADDGGVVGGRLLAALAAVGRGGAGSAHENEDTARAAATALASVCDVKTIGDDTYLKFSEARAIAWLKLKAAATGAALRASAGGGAAASLDDAGAAAAGAALLAEWLPAEWAVKIGAPAPGVRDAAAAATTPAPGSRWCVAGDGAAAGPENVPPKRQRIDPKELARAKAAAAREEARTAARKKEAKTMKSLTAFFAPKKAA